MTKEEKDSITKKMLHEFFGYLDYKIANDLLTIDEMRSMYEMFTKDMRIVGTEEDFARFYNKSRTNVSSVINRNLVKKPVRKVFYDFGSFQKVVPEKWKNHK